MKLHLWKTRLNLSDDEMKVLKTLLDYVMKDKPLSKNIFSGYDEDLAILGIIQGKVTALDKMGKKSGMGSPCTSASSGSMGSGMGKLDK